MNKWIVVISRRDVGGEPPYSSMKQWFVTVTSGGVEYKRVASLTCSGNMETTSLNIHTCAVEGPNISEVIQEMLRAAMDEWSPFWKSIERAEKKDEQKE